MLQLSQRTFTSSLRGLQSKMSPVGNPQGKLLLIGSGWGVYNLVKTIDTQNYDVTVVSLQNHFVFTPLLAQTSVGTLEFRSAIEPVRTDKIKFHQASCDQINFDQKTVQCSNALTDEKFSLDFDKLVIACGARVNTFNIPGVEKYAHFLKNITNARDIRRKIIGNLEQASLTASEQERKRLCSFVAVGAGPTGVEFLSELKDLFEEDVGRKYPELMKDVTLSLYDVAPRILPTFDEHLSQYTTKIFERRGIQVLCGKGVVKVTEKTMSLSDGSEVPYGLMIWSAGIKQTDLVNDIALPKDRMKRLLTDNHLRVLNSEKKPMRGIYAIGDCATIDGMDLPCTAQVACQKGIYLSKALNLRSKAREDELLPFEYKHRGSMAYVGSWRAVVQLENGKSHTGFLGGLIWRSAYVSMATSFRNKIKIPTYWILTWLTGRELSHFN